MNAKLTQDELQAIKERAEKATDGPWEVGYGEYDSETALYIEDMEVSGELPRQDAEFIAHARQDIPQLVAEVERLQAQLSECASLLSDAHDVLDDVHCYETDIYVAITNYFNGEGDDD